MNSGKQFYLQYLKYSGIKLIKEVKDLYSENYRTLKKKIEDIRRWKDLPHAQSGEIHSVKMTVLSKTIQRFNIIYNKIQTFVGLMWWHMHLIPALRRLRHSGS